LWLLIINSYYVEQECPNVCDPDTRAAPLDVINSRLMAELIEKDDVVYCEDDIVKSYIALAK
jgi:hypothetical protein